MHEINYGLLVKTTLFNGYSEQEIKSLLESLKYTISKYEKDSFIFHMGDLVDDIGLILNGSVQIESIDILGNKTILGITQKGNIFAEAYACTPNCPLMVDVVARENTTVLFINVPFILKSVSQNTACVLLLQNLLQATAKKNLNLTMRIFHSAPKSIRAKVLSYFSEQTAIKKNKDITIPLNRQELADYLGVDRTALSKELSKMKQEGLIDYRTNNFIINI